jgi:hypothetical protein
VDADGPDDVAGTQDDNLRLRPDSAAIDAGANAVDTDPATPGHQPLPTTDLDGNPRFVDDPNTEDSGLGDAPLVDRGAYEFQPSAAPPALLMAAMSRRTHGGLGSRDIPIDPAGRVNGANVTSEPRSGGLTELRLTFDVRPGVITDDGVTVLEQRCGPTGPADGAPFSPYSGMADLSAEMDAATGELVVFFSPALENARTYRLLIGGDATSLAGQSIDVRGLRGDANNDGRVNAADRSAVVGVWTGAGFSPRTDIDGTGRSNSLDREAVVSAWTGAEWCAP